MKMERGSAKVAQRPAKAKGSWRKDGNVVLEPAPDDRLSRTGDILALQLTKVAVRTIYVAFCGSEKQLDQMKRNWKYTPEFEALHQTNIPPEVRAWVQANFWDAGVLRDAVESEMRIALARCKADRGDPPGQRFDTLPALLLPHHEEDLGRAMEFHCTPLCTP